MVTGSRTWTDEYLLSAVLRSAYVHLGGHKAGVTLVHGYAHGADQMAERVWRLAEHAQVERHPVTPEQWRTIGKGAGFARNIEMVKSDIDLCVAFLKECREDCIRYAKGDDHWTHGSQHAMDCARGEGVPVWVIGSTQ